MHPLLLRTDLQQCQCERTLPYQHYNRIAVIVIVITIITRLSVVERSEKIYYVPTLKHIIYYYKGSVRDAKTHLYSSWNAKTRSSSWSALGMFFTWRVSIFTVTNPDDDPHALKQDYVSCWRPALLCCRCWRKRMRRSGGGPYRARGLIDCHPPILPRLPSPLPDDRLLETAGVDVPNGKILLSPAKRALSK